MTPTTRLLAVAVACAALPYWNLPVRAQDSDRGNIQQMTSQQISVKSQTQNTATQLDAIIAEFVSNGMGKGQDVDTLRGIRKILSKLSDKDMDKVVALLQAARAAPTADAMRQNVADAFSQQQVILSQLNDLVLRYQKQQDLLDISVRFGQLADRQNLNMKAAVRLVLDIKDAHKSLANYNDAQKARLQIQQSEEASIHDETAQLLTRVQEFVAAAEPAEKTRLQSLQDNAGINSLVPTLGAAADDLAKGNLFSSASKQQIARNQLRDLARMIAPPKDPSDIIAAAIEQLDRSIADQQQVLTLVPTLIPANPDAPLDVEDREADLVDSTNELRKDLASVADDVATDLKTTQDTMQQARTAIRSSDQPNATSTGNAALAGLKAAKDKLTAQLARLDQPAPGDLLDQSKALKDEIVQLRINEQSLKGKVDSATDVGFLPPLATTQKTLAATSQDLYLRSSTDLPAAAPFLKDATTEMNTAQSDLAAKTPVAETGKPINDAIANLLKAEQAADAAIAELEQKEKELADLEAAREKTAKLIEAENKTDAATAKLAATADKDPAPNKAAADAQAKTQDDTKKLTDDVKTDAPDASKALDQAANSMANAKNDLNNAKAADAKPQTTAAVAQLNDAKAALDKQIAQLNTDLNKPTDDASKLDDAAKALEQAQKDVGTAMTQPAADDPTKQLADAQKAIANDLNQMAQQPNAPAAVAQAQAAAAAAAQDLQNNDMKAAAASMQQAQTAMAAAAPAAPAAPAPGAPAAPAAPAAGAPAAPAAGAPAAPAAPAAGAPAAPAPAAGAPAAPAAPAAGAPAAGAPAAGAPAAGAPAAGAPAAGAPAAGAPAAGAPAAGAPAAGAPAGGAPAAPGAPAGGPAPALAQLQQQQTDVQNKLNALMAQAAAADAQAAAQANALDNASQNVTAANAESAGALPDAASAAMTQAAAAMNAAAAAAAAANQPGAQAAAAQAQSAMAAAQAAIAAAQAGMAAGPPGAGPPGAPGAPGAGPPGPPGSGPPMPGMTPGGIESTAQGNGMRNDDKGVGNSAANVGDVRGTSAFLGLPPRDRNAIQQSRADKYPQEYGPMIQQYFKNLSDQDNH